MNLCKDCQYCEWRDGLERKIAFCLAPQRPRRIDSVSGGTRFTIETCLPIRDNEKMCGPDAHWFVPREPEQVAA